MGWLKMNTDNREDDDEGGISGKKNQEIKHLTIEEMDEFLGINEINDRSVYMLARVNAHLIHCIKCRWVFELYKAKKGVND